MEVYFYNVFCTFFGLVLKVALIESRTAIFLAKHQDLFVTSYLAEFRVLSEMYIYLTIFEEDFFIVSFCAIFGVEFSLVLDGHWVNSVFL